MTETQEKVCLVHPEMETDARTPSPLVHKFKKSNNTYKIQNDIAYAFTSYHFHFLPYVTLSLLTPTPCPYGLGMGGGGFLFHPLNILYLHVITMCVTVVLLLSCTLVQELHFV